MFFNRRTAALVGLGFASGLPYLMTQDLPTAWLARVGADEARIGAVAGLLVLPYTLKFLWAPLMDRYTPPIAQLGRRRGWLLLTQVGLVAALVAMALTGPTWAKAPLSFFMLAAFAVALLSASQDIVADAYRTDVLHRDELGPGAAVFVTGYRVALIVSGAGAMFIAGALAHHMNGGAAWRVAYLCIAAVMTAGVVATLLAPEPERQPPAPATLADAILHPLRAFFAARCRLALLVLLFIALFPLPEEMAKAMTNPLLIKHLQFDQSEVGIVKQAAGFAFTIAGALAGGAVVVRLGIYHSLWVFGVLHAVSNLGLCALAVVGRSHAMLVAAIAVENFCMGLAQAGFVAFLMSQCDQRYSAFQYALLTSVMRLSGVIGKPLAGAMVAAMGYRAFFAVSVFAGVPSLALLAFLRGAPMDRRTRPAAAAQDA